MRAVLEASGVQDRKVWVVDSFEGCPIPNEEEYPHDAGDKHHTFENLVSLLCHRSEFQPLLSTGLSVLRFGFGFI